MHSYLNPTSVLATIIFLPIFTAITIVARIYALYLRKEPQKITIDLCLAVAAWIVLVGLAFDVGVGHAIHIVGYNSDLTPEQVGPAVGRLSMHTLYEFGQTQLAFYLLWISGITIAKASLLFFYRRVFGRGRIFRIANTALIVIVILWGIIFFFLILFNCGSHVLESWSRPPNVPGPPGQCLPTIHVIFANSLTDSVLDVAVIIMPMSIVWGLQMPTKTRIGVMAIFALGVLCIAASVFKLVFWGVFLVQGATHPVYYTGISTSNLFGVTSLSLFWSFIEMGVAAVVCNLPTVRPVFTQTKFGKLLNFFESSTASLRSRRSSSWPSSRHNTEKETPPHEVPFGVFENVSSKAERGVPWGESAEDNDVYYDQNILVHTNISTFTGPTDGYSPLQARGFHSV